MDCGLWTVDCGRWTDQGAGLPFRVPLWCVEGVRRGRVSGLTTAGAAFDSLVRVEQAMTWITGRRQSKANWTREDDRMTVPGQVRSGQPAAARQAP